MPYPRLIVVTGLPGTGKTTLARELARRFRVPLIGKDLIKEPLLDVLGTGDGAHSRRLSDASFAVQIRIARELLAAGAKLILEGNFRSGEHEAMLQEAFPPDLHPDTEAVQVMCRVEESIRLSRLRHRAADPGRHAGHRDAQLAVSPAQAGGSFLDLPLRRLEFDAALRPPRYDELAAELLK